MGLEIISGVERRRRWSDADKLRIVAEADEAGATVAEVARRHEIRAGSGNLHIWDKCIFCLTAA